MDDGINMGLLIAMIEQKSGADPAVIEQAVQDWLEDHPEATTTVQDGSITLAKLASDVAAKINQVSQLSDEIDGSTEDITITPTFPSGSSDLFITAAGIANNGGGAFKVSNRIAIPENAVSVTVSGRVLNQYTSDITFTDTDSLRIGATYPNHYCFETTGEHTVLIPSGMTSLWIDNNVPVGGSEPTPGAAYYFTIASQNGIKDTVTSNTARIADISEVANKSAESSQSVYISEQNGQLRDSMLGTYAKLQSGNLKWTILGDSITDTWDGHAQAGGGASDAAHGYAKITARWLTTKYGNGLTFVNNGTGGATVAQSVSKVSDYLAGNNFDLIIVALGTNDWNAQTNLTTFETNVNALIDAIQNQTTAEIAWIGLGYFADWKPEKTIRENEYNAVLQNVAKTRGIRFACPYYEMKNAILNGGYSFADITYASDPVHPNDIGHRIWADTAYKLFDIL